MARRPPAALQLQRRIARRAVLSDLYQFLMNRPWFHLPGLVAKRLESTYEPETLPLPLGSHVILHQFHACALSNGTVSCWGQGAMGQVGDGSIAIRQ